MRLMLVAVLATVVIVVGCTHSQQYDIMSAPAKCDTVPLPLRPGEQIGGVIPAARRAGQDSVLVIGTLVEATTTRALQGGSVALFDRSAPIDRQQPIAIAATNVTAGFLFIAPRPGSYTLVARHVGYQTRTQPVELQVGMADTLRLELQYHYCVGY
jgi:hypothetical protein